MDWHYYKNCLEKAGIEFEKGLSDSEIKRIESKFEFRFPPDLKELLQIALPIGKKFVDWRNESEEDIKYRLNWAYDGICFDIEYNDFWLKDWGEKPSDLAEAFKIAYLVIEKAPKLIPIYSHRFIPDRPNERDNPVFSVSQTDIIIYGANLPSYLRNEFSYSFENKIDTNRFEEKRIEFWSMLVDFNN